jgi:hypothetical protein
MNKSLGEVLGNAIGVITITGWTIYAMYKIGKKINERVKRA